MIVGDAQESPYIPNDAAFSVDASDVDALARALRLLVDETALRLRLGEVAADRVRKELHPARVTQRFVDAIAALAAFDSARCAAGVTRRAGELAVE